MQRISLKLAVAIVIGATAFMLALLLIPGFADFWKSLRSNWRSIGGTRTWILLGIIGAICVFTLILRALTALTRNHLKSELIRRGKDQGPQAPPDGRRNT